jgi:hypothetical protein
MRCRLNVFNCCAEKAVELVATEPLSNNGRSIIRLFGATPQYYEKYQFRHLVPHINLFNWG